MSLFTSTLTSLLAPRRVAPLLVVTGGMLTAELTMVGADPAVLVDLALAAAFVLAAPASFRALCSERRRGVGDVRLGWLLYLSLLAALVLALGVALPLAALGHWTYVTEPPSIAVVYVLFVVGGWGLGRDIELEEGLAAETRRADALALESERAQLVAIRTHLDPHFLFNTLNAIAEWCREDPETAETATLKLAEMLRTMLDGVREPAWPLEDEAALLEQLGALYAARDPDRFRIEVRRDGAPPGVEVPPMLLLPLLENAVKHGPSAGHEGAVTVRLASEDERLVVTVRNPGAWAGARPSGRRGQGLDILERRLALAYCGEARLDIGPDGDEHTRAVLRLPRRALSPEEVTDDG